MRPFGPPLSSYNIKFLVTVQRHRICFVIGQFAYGSIANQPLSRIYGTAEQLQHRSDATFFASS